MKIHGYAVLTRVSNDTRRLLDQTCRRHGLRLSELLREAIFDKLTAEGLDLPPEAAARRVRPAGTICQGACR